jgi:YVTN family beta-propeller protein
MRIQRVFAPARFVWPLLALVAAAALPPPHLAAAETPPLALLVGNKDESTLAIVDPVSGKVAGRVPTGQDPHEVAASADGKLAFVANYGTGPNPGSTISVIDVAAQKELRKVDVSPMRRPHGLAVAGGKVYFTAEMNKTIGRYDPVANQIDWLMGTGQNTTHMVLVAKDLNRIFTANIGSDTITALERDGAAGNWNATQIPVGKGPEAIAFTPDESQVWTAHSRDGGVSVIDVATRKVIGTLDVKTRRSNRLKFTPDGKRVLITDLESGELMVFDVASRREIKRLKLGKMPEGILMAPDGARAYVAVAGDNRVAIVDLKTLEVSGHLSTGNGPDGMAWAERR